MDGIEFILTLYFAYTMWFIYALTKHYQNKLIGFIEDVLAWKDEVDDMEQFYKIQLILLATELDEKTELLKLTEKLP